MRLSDKQIADIKEYFTRSSKIKISSIIHKLSTDGLNLIDTIKTLQQENEQLQAKLDEWKYEAKCHMDEVAARDKEIERLKAQVDTLSATINVLAPDEIGKECRHIEALRKAREALCKGISELKVHCKYFDNTPEEDACIEMHEAILEIDKAIGGKEDVTSMGD